MKKLSSTWRQQKPFILNQPGTSTKNEQPCQAVSRRRLGRFPITTSSMVLKTAVNSVCEIDTITPCKMDNDSTEDNPFSDSLDADFLKALETEEEKALVGKYQPLIESGVILTSNSEMPKKTKYVKNCTMALEPALSSKLASKRKYIKTPTSHTTKVDSNADFNKQPVVCVLRASSSSNFSPTCSPMDKRPKCSVASISRTTRSSNSSNLTRSQSSKPSASSAVGSKFSEHVSTASISTVKANEICSLNDSYTGNSSLNLSDFSFSPLSLGGDADMFDSSEDEASNFKHTVNIGLVNNERSCNNKSAATLQKQLFDHACKNVTNATIEQHNSDDANCHNNHNINTVTTNSEFLVKTQNQLPQNQMQASEDLFTGNIRSQDNDQSVKSTPPPAKQSGKTKGCYHRVPKASENINDCNSNNNMNKVNKTGKFNNQQKNAQLVDQSKMCVANLENSKARVGRSITPEIMESCREQQRTSFTSRSGHRSQEDSCSNTSLTVDKRQLSSWGLPEPVLEAYSGQGVLAMFEWQAECLLTGNVLDGGNLVYSAPTSAGKTLVAELLILKRVLESRKKALFILPFVSVVREKVYSLQRLYQDAGIRVGGFMGSHSPPGGFSHIHIAVCTIEKGNSLINRLMEEGKLGDLGAVVIDELHMVGDSHRGYLLELMLTKLAYVTQRAKDESTDCQVQIIGMSATLPNLPLLAKWLNASLYSTDFRPVPLNEYIKIDRNILNEQLIIQREIPADLISPDDVDHVIALCLETVGGGHGVLVFCPTKNWCEKLCEAVARKLYTLFSNNQEMTRGTDGVHSINTLGLKINLDKSSLVDTVEQLRRSPAGLDSMLGKCVLNGVAYHHAGLTFDERDIIEGAFRQGHLKILVATSTLSSGVNLPARRVIIRSPMFYGKVIDTLTYKQMVGRAGRKGIDTEGESILICKPAEKNVGRKLMESSLPSVKSCLHFDTKEGLTGSLKRAILEVVVSGVAPTPRDVITYINCTLLSASLSEDTQNNVKTALVDSCIQFLQDNEFVTVNVTQNEDGAEIRKFYPTQLGSAILASSLSPDEGLLIFAELQKARRAFVLDTELHIIYLVTPVYTTDVSTSIDWYHYHHLWETLTPADRRVADLVGISESFIARAIQGRVGGKTEALRRSLSVHHRFYTALILNNLVQESPLMEVAARFHCNKGQLQSLQQSASTYAGMITVFCGRLGWHSLELILSQFHKRLSFGVQQELIDLVRISTLNATSARMLYNAGYHTVTDVARAESADIENLFKHAVPFQSEKRQDGETDWELKERRRARCIWLTGRKGVTELDAALAIIEEAKVIVQGDLGVIDIVWGATNKMEEEFNKDEEESSVTEVHTEVSCTKELGNQNVEKRPVSNKSQGNTVIESKSTYNTGNADREMSKQDGEVSDSIGSCTPGHRQLCTDLTQRKSLSSSRRHSNASFRKSVCSFNHSRSKDISFFGLVVVSPPVGVKVRVKDTGDNSASQRTVSDKVLCKKIVKIVHNKDTADGEVIHEHERLTDVALQRKNKHESQFIKGSPAVPSTLAHSDSAAAITNTSRALTIHLNNEHFQGLSVETPHLSFQVMNSNGLKEGRLVDDSTALVDDSISFSDSFNIDTQTANMINQYGQEAEHNDQTDVRLNYITSPIRKFKISVPESDTRVHQTSAVRTDKELIKDTDNIISVMSPDPFIDSICETLALEYEIAEQKTPEKSAFNITPKNVDKSLSETLFDSAEKRPIQKPTMCIGSTPKRSTVKSIHCLQYQFEDGAVMNTVVSSKSRKCSHEAGESLSGTVRQSQSSTNKNIDYCSDEEEICTSLIAASNFERLMQMDEGMLEENANEELDYSSADFHIIDTEVDLNPEDSPFVYNQNHHERILKDVSRLESKRVVSCYDNDDAPSISKKLLELDILAPRNSTPVADVNVKRQNSQRVPHTDHASKEQTRKLCFEESKQISNDEDGNQCLARVADPTGENSESGMDSFFSDSFSSSLMDKIMAECEFVSKAKSQEKKTSEFVSKAKSQEKKTSVPHKNSSFNCNENDSIYAHILSGEASINNSLSNTPTAARKDSIEPPSNNSSKNDGSDCVPPTPPERTLNGQSPFKVSIFSPLRQNISRASNSHLIPQRANPKYLANKDGKENFTIIKDPKFKTTHLLHNINMHAAQHVPEDASKDYKDSEYIQAPPSTHNCIQEKNKCSVNPPEPNNGATNGQNDSFESAFHSQHSSAVMLTQQSFTIVDVCANRQLFETFLAELKSKSYYALSVACEKKPPEGQQKKQSEIGGKFLKKKTSTSASKTTVTIGIPVPDSDAFIVGLAFSWENRDSYFVSLMPAGFTSLESHPDDTLAEPSLDETLSQDERITAVSAVLSHHPATNKQTAAVYNSKAAYVCLVKALGLSLPQCEDPCVADWLREPDARLKNLHRMVVTYCSEELGLLDAVGGINGYQSMGSDIKSQVNGRIRACTESVLTQKLMNRFHRLLTDENLLTAFTEVEMPSIVTLARMELNGFGISEPEIEKQKALLTAKLNILEAQAYQMAGHTFSLTSTSDIATVLYQELKLPINGDTKVMPHLPAHTRRSLRTPIGSTSKEILEKLQKFHPLPAVILEWRRLSSALTKSLYALKRAARHCPKLGMFRVYGDWQIFTSTGRVSMAEPNLQNVPKDFAVDVPICNNDTGNATAILCNSKTNNHKRASLVNKSKHEACDLNQASAVAPVSMRKMFVPFKGGVILAADYSQLELRIIAHLSGDSRLITILNTKDGDVFKIIAAQMKGLDIAEVSNEHRQQAKQVCYGMLYGIGPKALAEQLGMIDEHDADAFMETFKSRYPAIRKYLKHTVEFCQKNGYVKTLFNRRRYLPSIKDNNPHARSQAERQAVNTTIQGSAADLVKIAMTNIDGTLMDLFPDTRTCHTQSLPLPAISARKDCKIPRMNGAFLVLQLHDELLYEVSANQVQEVARLVKHHMEGAVKLSLCMPVKIKVGPSWGELQDYDVLD